MEVQHGLPSGDVRVRDNDAAILALQAIDKQQEGRQ